MKIAVLWMIKKNVLCLLLLAGPWLMAACSRGGAPSVGDQVVMHPGMRIDVVNQHGNVSVIAGEGTARTYRWDGNDKTIKLRRRTEPWRGLTGIYDPASYWLDESTRVVAQEGQLHVHSVEEAMTWMRLSAGQGWVYTDDGLMVGFLKSPERNQINVDVVQIYTAGHKPTTMPGAKNEAIVVSKENQR